MALAHVKGRENIPENARILSKQEALLHQQKFVNSWEKPSEVFFLKYGGIIAGVATCISSFPIVHHFRKHFKLNKFGSVLTYAPAALMPASLTFVGYNELVTSDILLMKTQCPLCMEFKYAAFHLFSSIFYTTGVSALTCVPIAIARKTRYVPLPQTEGKELVNLFWNVLKAGSRRYQAITAFQLIVIIFLPYLQVREFNNLVEAAAEKERSKTESLSSESLFDNELVFQ